MKTKSLPIAPALVAAATLLASTHASSAQTAPVPARPDPVANEEVVTPTEFNG